MTKPKRIKLQRLGRLTVISRNNVTQAIENAHTDYQRQLFDTKLNTVSKKFWKDIKGLRKDHTGISSLKVDGTTIRVSY